MKGELVVAKQTKIRTGQVESLPVLIEEAGDHARFAWDEFFALHNQNTKRVYRIAVERFLHWCHERELRLTNILPGHVAEYIANLAHGKTGQSASDATRSLYLSAIRHFLDVLVQRHAMILNPARSVRGPAMNGNEGKTAPLPEQAVPEFLESLEDDSLVGLRDRAIIGTLLYTAARRGAVAKLRLKDFWTDSTQFYLRFFEKGGKERNIPVRHDLQEWITAYIDAAGIVDEPPESPLFRAAINRSGRLGEEGLKPAGVSKLVKRRLKAAGLPVDVFKAHSFRATTITNLLGKEEALQDVQELAGHSDSRTTQRYNHSGKKIKRNLVEKIGF